MADRRRFERAAEELLLDLYIAAPGARLRIEDRRKAAEVGALCARIGRLVPSRGGVDVVDLACGQGYAGIAAAHLLGPRARLVGVERSPARVARCREVARTLGLEARFEHGEVASVPLPDRPDLVISLHACAGATDDAIARIVALEARAALVLPCCHARRTVPAPQCFAKHGVLRRRWDVLSTDARRVLELEAAGYAVTVAELVAPTVSPDNLVLECRRIGPSRRATRAARVLATMKAVQAGGFEPPFTGPKPAVLPLDDA